jgi:hypothetical protein
MTRRPLSVTLLSLLLIATGAFAIIGQVLQLRGAGHAGFDDLGVSLVRLMAIVAGAFMLRGSNWARWLAMAWIASHVVMSIFHSPFELALHILVCALFAWCLFRPLAAVYFSGAQP